MLDAEPSYSPMWSLSFVRCAPSTLIRAVNWSIFHVVIPSIALLMLKAVMPISRPHAAVSTQRPTEAPEYP